MIAKNSNQKSSTNPCNPYLLTNDVRNYIDPVLITNMTCSTLSPLSKMSWKQKKNTVLKKTQYVDNGSCLL